MGLGLELVAGAAGCIREKLNDILLRYGCQLAEAHPFPLCRLTIFSFRPAFVIQSIVIYYAGMHNIGLYCGESMNKTFGRVMKTVGIALVALVAWPAHAQLMLAHEGHHSGDCAVKNGAFPVAFSAYEKPKGSLPPMHAFCDHVPEGAGELHLTVDLTDLDSREIPIAVRVVMEGHGEGGHEILSLPAKAYPSGSITFEATFDDPGQYAVLLETEKDGKMTPAVRIPVHVGGGGGHGSHGSGFGVTEIALLVAAAGVAAFFLMRRRTSAKAS
jgi:hypothetical protein